MPVCDVELAAVQKALRRIKLRANSTVDRLLPGSIGRHLVSMGVGSETWQATQASRLPVTRVADSEGGLEQQSIG